MGFSAGDPFVGAGAEDPFAGLLVSSPSVPGAASAGTGWSSDNPFDLELVSAPGSGVSITSTDAFAGLSHANQAGSMPPGGVPEDDPFAAMLQAPSKPPKASLSGPGSPKRR